MKYIWNLLIALDQLLNAVFGGDPDETISSRMGKWSSMNENKAGWRHYIAKPLCRVLHVAEADHCAKSIEADEGKDEVLR